ncbi:MAG: helical backbone metal receptor [Planctomycetota bacterium]
MVRSTLSRPPSPSLSPKGERGGVPVYVFDVCNWQQGIESIQTLGELTACEAAAKRIADEASAGFDELRRAPGPTAAYLLWKKPYMVAGGRTYIDSVMELCGLRNVFAASPERYPTVTVTNLREQQPEFVLLSSEPYAFGDEHVVELAAQLPRSRVVRVDGEMFGWYGSRMIPAAAYLREMLARELRVES